VTNIPEGDLVAQGALPPDDFHTNIERIREVATEHLEIPDDIVRRLAREATHLLVDRALVLEAASALQVGHLILQGPPGTGKSSLARALCRAFHCSAMEVTAHEDWSTFEVIGRQSLVVDAGGERIVPVNGFFTEAVVRCAEAIVRHADCPEEPQATWLLIDELNRAHLDKAFGELFTVLGTDEPVAITLPHQHAGNRELVAPERFRIVATLNSIDRQFVNNLGQGLKRRFTFITVDVPAPRKPGEQWGSADPHASPASREYTVVMQRAAERVARRLAAADDTDPAARQAELMQLLTTQAVPAVHALFELVESVRYTKKGVSGLYLPIGTAQMIDTVELFLGHLYFAQLQQESFADIIDWAASLKLAPLFDSDTISPTDLERYALNLPSPFNQKTRRELLTIVSAGQYYVE
jgi:MoxR-like ATPase